MDWTTGDTVRLQSGGPPTTIVEIKHEESRREGPRREAGLSYASAP